MLILCCTHFVLYTQNIYQRSVFSMENISSLPVGRLCSRGERQITVIEWNILPSECVGASSVDIKNYFLIHLSCRFDSLGGNLVQSCSELSCFQLDHSVF